MPAVLLLLNTVVFWMEQSGRGEEVEGVNLLGGRGKPVPPAVTPDLLADLQAEQPNVPVEVEVEAGNSSGECGGRPGLLELLYSGAWQQLGNTGAYLYSAVLDTR